jgi:hypothetical protein
LVHPDLGHAPTGVSILPKSAGGALIEVNPLYSKEPG